MIGCAEFILVYDWTFEYLRRTYGHDAVQRYWEECISVDSQTHARELIIPGGIAGMEDMKKVGKTGGFALLYFEIVSTIALVVGLT
ncbi:MAG: hypothetical protein WCP21_07645, partial [Armatimonadota bacterium]